MNKLQAAIDRLLQDQADETNLIEALWQLFAASVAVPTGGVQWIESRRCFFMGAAVLFEAIQRVLDPGTEPTDRDLARMGRIVRELERFQADVASGVA